jgi:hypothetical protein
VLATAMGLPLPLAPLGFFLTDEAVAFLGVVRTTDQTPCCRNARSR